MRTIVLIHGWDNKNYTKYGHNDAWYNREDLVTALSKYFKVVKLNLPGFCGEPEPNRIWELHDYAKHFQNFLLQSNVVPDVVLGYSFGAAVATQWKFEYKTRAKLALVSPAICRAYKKKSFIQNFFFLKKLIPSFINNLLRDYYLRKIGNQFYLDGSKFLKGSYLNIVKIDLSEVLKKMNPDLVLIIFGSKDTATPPNILLSRVKGSSTEDRIVILENGSHDIANSHFSEISKLIVNFSENGNHTRHSE